MANKNATGRVVEFDPKIVRDISFHVYRQRLGESDYESMLAKKGEAKMREYSGAYDLLTRCYLRAFQNA